MNSLENQNARPVIPAPVEAQPEVLAYDINQSAAALNMSTKTVRRQLIIGRLTRCKGIRKILIPRKQIDDFFKINCDVPKPPR